MHTLCSCSANTSHARRTHHQSCRSPPIECIWLWNKGSGAPKISKEGPIVAGWREFRDHSLPCVGLVETVNGFVPFTGRRHEHRMTLPSGTQHRQSGTRTGVLDNQRHSQLPILTRQHRLPEDQDRSRYRQTEEIRELANLSNARSSFPLRDPTFVNHQQAQGHQTRPALVENSSDLSTVHLRHQDSHSHTFRNHQEAPSENLISSPACIRRQLAFVLDAHFETSDMSFQSHNSPPHSPFVLSSASSLFTISPRDAVTLVRSQQKNDDSRHCYLIHLTLRPLFGEDVIPGTSLRKLPRLINGIPLGPGFLSRDQTSEIKWRLVEGGHSILTFISSPLLRQEAEECKCSLKERLFKNAQAVFGDLTVKVGVVLSKCLDFDDDITLNDVAEEFGEGLHFRD